LNDESMHVFVLHVNWSYVMR